MEFLLRKISEDDILAIQCWRYDPPYDLYNFDRDQNEAESKEEMLDPRSPYYAVENPQGELSGFFNFGSSAEVFSTATPGIYSAENKISIGLGMRPDLTGKGLGLAFVEAGLAFARLEFRPRAFRLYVLPFNRRAIHVYEKAGFEVTRYFTRHNQYGMQDFLEMEKDEIE